MPLYGKGRKGILVVGEAPGAEEDEKGIPFIGKSGRYIRAAFEQAGVDFKRDCWVTNANICRPQDNTTPKDAMVLACRPHLLRVIREVKPTVIVLVGTNATNSLISWLWKESIGPLARWVGWQIPSQLLNAWVCPVYHPSFLHRQHNEMMDSQFNEHISNAVDLADKRPWKEVPNWTSRLKVCLDPDEAVPLIRQITESADLPAAADYETNALKPEYDGAKILSCALVNRDVAVSFPWHGNAIKATSRFWKSDVPKIAAKLGFEDRWTRKMLGHGVRRWYWDTVLAAHVLDCRQGITSVKFQSFVHLGVGEYNDHIAPFLEASEGSAINLAETEIEPRQLYRYGGEDSLYEYYLALKQIKLMNGRVE